MSEEVEKFNFDVEFEKKILKLLIDDPNFIIKATKYLRKEYFDTNILQWCFKVITDYFNKYQKTVTQDVFIQEIMALPDTENRLEYVTVVKNVFQLEVKEKEYVVEKVEEFIKRNVFVKHYKDAALLYNKDKFQQSLNSIQKCVEEVNKVSFAAPHRSSFFEDTNDRIYKRDIRSKQTDYKFTTGVFELDVLTGGGMSRGELGIVVADAKVGKSIFLLNVAAAVVLSFGGKVLHINLEGKNGQVEDRYESRLLFENYRNVTKNIIPDNTFKRYQQYGQSLVISNFISRWDYTAQDIEQEINDLKAYDFIPDMIIVDYGDLLCSRTVDKENKYAGQEEVFRDLKTICGKYNVALWTASQVHRVDKLTKPEEDMNFIYTRRNLADCYAKVRIADLLITLNLTNSERTAKRMRLYVDAYRDSECGQIIPIMTNYEKMQFYVPNQTSYQKFNSMHVGG